MLNYSVALNCLLISVIFIGYFYHKRRILNITNKLSLATKKILALTASHLHDSANFFNLINKHLETKDQHSIYNFAKGASFHFRSLFEEISRTIENITKGSNSIYAKDLVNLKDILDLELFQISSFDRLEFIDKTNSEFAFINGNFSLLSKVFLNLIENSLKYTEHKIKILLTSEGHQWGIEIFCYGKDLPFEMHEAIRNRNQGLTFGHGFSSILDILDFHEASINSTTLADEGSVIILKFDKYQDPMNSTKDQKTFTWLYVFLLLIILVAGIFLIYFKKNSIKKTQNHPKSIIIQSKKNNKKEKKPMHKSENLDDLIKQQDRDLNLELSL